MKVKKCNLCGQETQRLELPSLYFNFLEGCPMVCEKCIAEKLGIKAEWIQAIKDDLK